MNLSDWQTVYVDGLADIRPTFELFVRWGLQSGFREDFVAPDIDPPHSISRLSKASGLTKEEYEEVKQCLSEVPGLWSNLEVRGSVDLSRPTLWLAQRFKTKPRFRAQSKLWTCPIVQTVFWIREHFQVEYPILIVTEDQWEPAPSCAVTADGLLGTLPASSPSSGES